jgi:hypothetical protein
LRTSARLMPCASPKRRDKRSAVPSTITAGGGDCGLGDGARSGAAEDSDEKVVLVLVAVEVVEKEDEEDEESKPGRAESAKGDMGLGELGTPRCAGIGDSSTVASSSAAEVAEDCRRFRGGRGRIPAPERIPAPAPRDGSAPSGGLVGVLGTGSCDNETSPCRALASSPSRESDSETERGLERSCGEEAAVTVIFDAVIGLEIDLG